MGGRVTPAGAAMGTLLSIKPLLVIAGALASIVFSLSPDFGALTAGHLLSLQGIWLVITLLCDGML